jgi:hypothetical protein
MALWAGRKLVRQCQGRRRNSSGRSVKTTRGARRKRREVNLHRPLPRGTPVGTPNPPGLAPRSGFPGVRRHLGSCVRRTVRADGAWRASGGSASRLGQNFFGPTRRTGARQRGAQENERVGLLRRRTQCWLDISGRYGRRSRGVSRGHQASQGVLESRCRIAHSRHGSPRSRQRTNVKTFGRVRSSRSRCARVPR